MVTVCNALQERLQSLHLSRTLLGLITGYVGLFLPFAAWLMASGRGCARVFPNGNEISPFLARIMSDELSPTEGMNQAADAGDKLLAQAGY